MTDQDKAGTQTIDNHEAERALEIVQKDVFNLTEKVIPNLREQLAALSDEKRALDEKFNKLRAYLDEQPAMNSQVNACWIEEIIK